MSSAYLHQINPVSVTALYFGTLSNSGGREKSFTFAAVIPHFIVGAQKKMVLGPAGWFQNDRALAANDMANAPRNASRRKPPEWTFALCSEHWLRRARMNVVSHGSW